MEIRIETSNNLPSSLGLSRSFNFLGEAFRYRITKQISVSGNLLDLTNTVGVSGITSEIETAIKNIFLTENPELGGELHDIIINGHNFGKGFANSISFSEGDDVRLKQYSASFTVYEEGSLGALGDYAPELEPSLLIFADSIQESFSFAANYKNKSYSHNVGMTAAFSEAGKTNIDMAKEVANILLESEDFPALYWKNKKVTFNTYYSESYNKITGQCSFDKNYELNELEEDGSEVFLKSRAHSFEVDNTGVIKVTESAEFTAKWDKIGDMIAFAKADLASCFDRCELIYNAGKLANMTDPVLQTSETLFDKATSKTFSILEKAGTASYSATYTNDLFFSKNYEYGVGNSQEESQNAYWEYKIDLQTNDKDVTTVTESGTIVGSDLLLGIIKQSAANSFWKKIKNEINTDADITPARISNAYHRKLNQLCFKKLYLSNWSVTKSNRLGNVSYSFSYTDDIARELGDLIGFKSLNYTCETQAGEQIKLSSNVVVPNHNEIKQEKNKNFIHENVSYSSSIVIGKKNKIDFYSIKDSLKAESTVHCLDSSFYVESATYSLNPIKRSASFNIQAFKPT